MNLKKEHNPTESELEILQVLWQEGPTTVRKVNEVLNQKREVGYTTTLKIMQIMTEKNLVTRNTDSRTHIYHAAAKQNATQNNLLNSFIEKTYKGSAMKMVMQVLGNKKASLEEITALKKMIKSLEEDHTD